MQTIGTNSIRVYHVDPSADHTGCMEVFANAGIYLWLDLDTFNTQIDQRQPMWNVTQRNAFAKVMDAFHHFDNLAGFYVGNEVVWSGDGFAATPYIKAAARDMKAHRDASNYRKIPIGYSNADLESLRPTLQNYLACGNASDTLDFFSLNAYSWCGISNYQISGYEMLKQNSSEYSIPIFFSETGCNQSPPRTFQDQAAVFGEMADKWSGSIVYEWIQEANNYGLIKYGEKVDLGPSAPPDGFPRSGTPTPVQPDFDNLSNVWKTPLPTGTTLQTLSCLNRLTVASGIQQSDYTPTLSAPACPQYTAGVWEIEPASALPTLGQTHKAEKANFAQPTSAASANQRYKVHSIGTVLLSVLALVM
ncbi:hypothetical protein M3J09_000525 [Ascochyta lentis]